MSKIFFLKTLMTVVFTLGAIGVAGVTLTVSHQTNGTLGQPFCQMVR